MLNSPGAGALAPPHPTSLFSPPLRVGDLELCLAQTPEDILAAKQLRYEVFCGEVGASVLLDPQIHPYGDPFDDVCDHLIVKDVTSGEVVGTYRLARRLRAEICGGFCTSSEYDLGPLLDHPNLLELSRSCVRRNYRTLPTMQLLWRGLAEYALAWDVDFFFGCGSFLGTNPQDYAHALSYLYEAHLAPAFCRPRARRDHYTDMRLLPPDQIHLRTAFAQMPPLIKGYIRAGGFVGDGAFVDPLFNVTDVCIVVKTDLMTKRYARHYNSRSDQTKRFQT